MKITVEVDKETLRALVLKHIEEKLGDVQFDGNDVKIETRSAQNFRSTWENADFRARIEVDA